MGVLGISSPCTAAGIESPSPEPLSSELMLPMLYIDALLFDFCVTTTGGAVSGAEFSCAIVFGAESGVGDIASV